MHQKSGSIITKAIRKKSTYRCYSVVMVKFCQMFGGHQLSELTADDIRDFLNQVTNRCKPQTKRIRYAHLSAFFNFIQNNIDPDLPNPCDSPMMRKLFQSKVADRKLLLREPKSDREFEIVFIPQKVADRLREYVRSEKIGLYSRIFPICYEAARAAS